MGLLALLFASITDFKRREVPDMLSYGLIFFALLFDVYLFIATKQVFPFLNILFSFVVVLALSSALFYSGTWGGGDSKLLMGLSLIFPLNLFPLPINLANLFYSPIVNFFINAIFIGALYGLIFTFYLALRKWKKVSKSFNTLNKKYERLEIVLFVIFIFALTLTWLSTFKMFSLFLASSLITSFLFIALFSIPFYAFMKSVEESVLIKKVAPSELTEGDWIVGEVKYKKEIIASSKDLGVSDEQIRKLKRLYNNKVIKKVTIKDGIPFVPSLLLTYILTLFLSRNILALMLHLLMH